MAVKTNTINYNTFIDDLKNRNLYSGFFANLSFSVGLNKRKTFDREELYVIVYHNDKELFRLSEVNVPIYILGDFKSTFSNYIFKDRSKMSEDLFKKLLSFDSDRLKDSLLEKAYAYLPNIKSKPVNVLRSEIEETIIQLSLDFASDPNCNPELLEEVSKVNDERVIKCLMSNPSCPKHILERLYKSHPELRDYDKRNYQGDSPEHYSNRTMDLGRKVIISKNPNHNNDLADACNPNSKLSRLEDLFYYNPNNELIYEGLSKNPKCDAKLLEELFRSSNSKRVKYNVIMNKSLPLKKLVPFFVSYIREYRVFSNEHNELIDKVLREMERFDFPVDSLRVLNNISLSNFGNNSSYGALDYLRKEKRLLTRAKELLTYSEQMENGEKLKSILDSVYHRNEHDPRIKHLDSKAVDKRNEEKINGKFSSVEARVSFVNSLREIKKKNVQDEHRIIVPRDELFVSFNDHIEIRQDYIEFIDYIDFSNMNTDKLKVSGLDLRGTNIVINPQTVFNKDLSGTALNDYNLCELPVFVKVILFGSDLSGVRNGIFGFTGALLDGNTKLPEEYNFATLKGKSK